MIIHDLKATTKRIDKEAILNKATEDSKSIFYYAYNPFLRYNLKFSDIRINTVQDFKMQDEDILLRLIDRSITGNEAREAVEYYCAEYGDLVKLICNKDLDCGVNAKTLLKLFGDAFIPSYDVQLATVVPIDKIKMPCIAQLKYNGTRVLAEIDKVGEVIFRTLNGNEFYSPKLANTIKKSELTSIVLDGELCFGDSQNSNHAKVSGLVNSSMKTGKHIDNDDLVFNVFNCLDLVEFEAKYCDDIYETRLGSVTHIVNDLIKDNRVQIAKTYACNNVKDLQKLFDYMLANGYEGLIVNDLIKDKYDFKRSKLWCKLKAEDTADLLCTGVTDGLGRFEYAIGSLICEGVVKGKKVTVGVGSGFSDNDRFINRDNYIGKIIEVKYNDVIKSEDGSYSLFLPVYICTRLDKS